MSKTREELLHKFPNLDTLTLRNEIRKTEERVMMIQRSKDHHKHRDALSVLQGTLHRMKMELKRREGEEKRARYSITPSATA